MIGIRLALSLSALIGLSTLTASAQNSLSGVPFEPLVAPSPNAVPSCAGGTKSGLGSAYVIGAGQNGGTAAFACNDGFANTIVAPKRGVYCLTLEKGGTHVKATQVTIDFSSSAGCDVKNGPGAGPYCWAQLDDADCPKATPPQSTVGVVTHICCSTDAGRPERSTIVNFTVFVP
jgi:hypothetical protein